MFAKEHAANTDFRFRPIGGFYILDPEVKTGDILRGPFTVGLNDASYLTCFVYIDVNGSYDMHQIHGGSPETFESDYKVVGNNSGTNSASLYLTPYYEYSVSVVDGTTEDSPATEGATVHIKADDPAEGEFFCYWTSDDNIVFADAVASETTFKMPAAPVTVTAVYKDILIDDISDQVYTGKRIEPGLGVKLDGVDLQPEEGADYSISYENNTNVGEAKATVTLNDPWVGRGSTTFKIVPADISGAEVTFDDQVYDGSPLQPVPKVIWNGQELEKDVDYTLTCSDNVNAGTAQATLTGKGNFTGEKQAAFKINEPEPAQTIGRVLMAKMTAKGRTGLVLSWNLIEDADGYDIFFVKCGKTIGDKPVKSVKSGKKLIWTGKGLKKNTAYKACVRAWVRKDGKKTYIRKSPLVHASTGGGGAYTNPGSVTVSQAKASLGKGRTYRIKASVRSVKGGRKLLSSKHGARLRYLSTDKKVATVDKSGKVTARGKGTCTIYVYAINGVRNAVKVTVN